MTKPSFHKIRKLLVANRSEIAIRVLRAATELGLKTVAVYAHEDRFALHRFKADESYRIGAGRDPISAYLDIDDVIRVARAAGADAIHPGYGFLAENPDFAEACVAAGLVFIGPPPDLLRSLATRSRPARWPSAPACPCCPRPARCRPAPRRAWPRRSAIR